MRYDLMHKNIPVLQCDIDLGHITKVTEIYNAAHAPVGTYDKNGIARKKLINWFEGRSIPASRDGIKEILHQLGVHTTNELLEKSYGLSLSDQYWIRPKGTDLTWERVNFFQNPFSDDIGTLLLEGKLLKDSRNLNLASPDNTLDGWLRKKWKIIDGERCLYKSGSGPFFQEPLNERIATKLCDLLDIRHIPYDLEFSEHGNPYSVCRDYITPDTELVTAYAVSSLLKQPGSESDYAHYIRTCKEFGLSDITENVDRMICVDYIMANTDRHWTNFGVVRDANTLEFLEPFPIYDTGTSLWNQTQEFRIGKEPVIGKMFQTSLERHLRYVKDASFLDFAKLERFPDAAASILRQSMYIQDSRADVIGNMLKHRIHELDREFAKGYVSVEKPVEKTEKITAWSPDTQKNQEFHEKLVQRLMEIRGLYLADMGKELGLLMQNGLDMKYYFETDTLALAQKDGTYRDITTFPESEIVFITHAGSINLIRDAVAEITNAVDKAAPEPEQEKIEVDLDLER